MKILQYFKESRDELLKVVWPTRKEVVEITAAVVILVIFVGAILGIFDYVLAKVLTYILSL